MMATWSANDSASSWSWVTRSTVAPAAAERVGDGPAGRRAQAGVQGAERLVEQHELGAAGQRAGQGDPLLLPSGELLGAPVGQGEGQPDQLEQLRRARAVTTLGTGQAEADVPRDGQVREQVALLGEVADAAPLGGHRRTRARDGAVADAHLTGIRGMEARDHPQQRGLAAPRGTEDRRGRPASTVRPTSCSTSVVP